MTKIKSIISQEILNSRGEPAIETIVVLSDGVVSKSSVPSGVSHGMYEAFEIRDTESKRFAGKGLSQAVANVEKVIAPNIIGMEVSEQQKIDKLMIDLDGTQNKSKLGSNSILSVSQAVLKAAAKSSLMPLPLYISQFLTGNKDKALRIPVPMFNVFEGGKHALGSINFQELLVVPASSKTYSEGLEIGTSIYSSLKNILNDHNIPTFLADEGGFASNSSTNREALGFVKSAIEQAGVNFSMDVFLGIDAGAQSFLDGKSYRLKDRASLYNQEELVEFYVSLFNEFSLLYIEDPFAEDDWDGWKKINSTLNSKTLIIGDDIVTTNPYRLQLALDNKVLSGLVIKPSQIGTITESLAVIEIAKYKNLKIIISDRSRETMDDFIADFAVGVSSDFVKFGAPVNERVVKYNRLLEIEKELKKI